MESLEELSVLAAGLRGAKASPHQEVKSETKPAKHASAKKTEPKEEAVEPVAEAEEASSDKATEDIPSIEDIRAKAQTIKDKAAVKALLEEFGAKNLTALPEDRRAEFMARLEEL